MNITIDDELLKGVELTPEQARINVAAGLYSARSATLGQAARIAGIPYAEMMRELGRRRIPMNYDVQAFEEDLRTLEQLFPPTTSR